jgi:hypothetical protein
MSCAAVALIRGADYPKVVRVCGEGHGPRSHAEADRAALGLLWRHREQFAENVAVSNFAELSYLFPHCLRCASRAGSLLELGCIATQLAKEFGFPANAVEDIRQNLALADALLRIKKHGRSLREQEREARRRLKANPEDDGAWCTLHRIQGGRHPVLLNLETRELIVEESRNEKRSRRRTEEPLNCAVLQLRHLWKKHRGPMRLNTWADAYCPGLAFLSTALTQHLGEGGNPLVQVALVTWLSPLFVGQQLSHGA